jgi:hypothetical protein
MEWVVKLEAQSGWGEVETIEVGRLKRRVVGLTAAEVGLTLAEGKDLLGELARRHCHVNFGRANWRIGCCRARIKPQAGRTSPDARHQMPRL